MSYTTIYTRPIPRKRIKGKLVQLGQPGDVIGCVYTTKNLTPMHAFIHTKHPDAQTWVDVKRVITDFVPGMNLQMMPLRNGGTRVDPTTGVAL